MVWSKSDDHIWIGDDGATRSKDGGNIWLAGSMVAELDADVVVSLATVAWVEGLFFIYFITDYVVSTSAIICDGSLLYSASWDQTYKVWQRSDFKSLESESKAHDDAIKAIDLLKDGYVYTRLVDKKIKVWISSVDIKSNR